MKIGDALQCGWRLDEYGARRPLIGVVDMVDGTHAVTVVLDAPGLLELWCIPYADAVRYRKEYIDAAQATRWRATSDSGEQ